MTFNHKLRKMWLGSFLEQMPLFVVQLLEPIIPQNICLVSKLKGQVDVSRRPRNIGWPLNGTDLTSPNKTRLTGAMKNAPCTPIIVGFSELRVGSERKHSPERELSLACTPTAQTGASEPQVADAEDSVWESRNDYDSSPGRFFGLMMSPCVPAQSTMSPGEPPSEPHPSEVSVPDNANAEPRDLFHQQSSKRDIRVPRMGYWIHQWRLRRLHDRERFSSSGRPGKGRYCVVHATGCVLRGGAAKQSPRIGLIPSGTRVEVLQTAMLDDGTMRGRIAASDAHLGGWLSLGARFVERLEDAAQPEKTAGNAADENAAEKRGKEAMHGTQCVWIRSSVHICIAFAWFLQTFRVNSARTLETRPSCRWCRNPELTFDLAYSQSFFSRVA